MGRRDVFFAAFLFLAASAITAELAIPGSRTRKETEAPAAPRPDVVDRVDAAFRQLWLEAGLTAAPRASELTRARRLSLALTGTIPSLEEIRRLERVDPSRLVDVHLDHLLSDRRSADYLAERLARAFVGTEGGPFIVYRRRRFVTWLGDELARNRPYDALVRDLIASQGIWTDRPGTNFVWVTYDGEKKVFDVERLAARVARAFLGARIDCAQCHDHPFQSWKRADFRGIAAYFGQVEATLGGLADKNGDSKFEDARTGKSEVVEPRVPSLPELDTKAGTRRERLARWVTDRRNPAFALATTNRVWALMTGRPLVEPVDDLMAAPRIPEPLTLLADDFASHGYDLRRLIRAIAATEVFALDSTALDQPTETLEAAWAAFPMTRLRPEQVASALLQAASPATIDAESHILVRLTTYGGVNDFVRRHGDPGEEELTLEPSSTIPQRLLMMNGDLVDSKTKDELGNAASRIAKLAPTDAKAIEAAFLAALTRKPTPEEAKHFEGRIAGTRGEKRVEPMSDLFWALLNSSEFSWNH
jgi:hypothetical protein